MSSTIRIEMVMPSEDLARAKFPEAKKTFGGGVSGLALKAAGLRPSIFLEGFVVVVEIGCRNAAAARQILPMFQYQAAEATKKESGEKGSCIEMRVFLKGEKQ